MGGTPWLVALRFSKRTSCCSKLLRDGIMVAVVFASFAWTRKEDHDTLKWILVGTDKLRLRSFSPAAPPRRSFPSWRCYNAGSYPRICAVRRPGQVMKMGRQTTPLISG